MGDDDGMLDGGMGHIRSPAAKEPVAARPALIEVMGVV
jgi:hypothetical protein